MHREALTWTHHRRVSNLYLVAIAGFAFLSLMAVLIARLDYFQPDGRVFLPRVFGQLLGLHEVLLQFFVLVPAIPAILGVALLPSMMGASELAFPRLGLASWFLFAVGGMLVLWAFVWGGVEPAWAYAVVHPASRDMVSGAFLLGLLLACGAMQLLALNLIVTVHRGGIHRATLFCRSLYWTSWLMVIVFPLIASLLFLGLVEKYAGLALFDVNVGGDPTLLAFLFAFAATPLNMMVLLPVLGTACAVLKPEQVVSAACLRHMSWCLPILAVLGLQAVDGQALPGTASPLLILFGAFNHVLLVAPLSVLLALLIKAGAQTRGPWTPDRIYAMGAILLIALLAPLDAFLSTPAARIVVGSYLASASFYLMVCGSALLAFFGGLHYGFEDINGGRVNHSLAVFFAGVTVFGLLSTVLPMLIMGLGGLPVEVVNYPDRFQPLQVFVFAGSTILAAGMLAAGAHLLFGRIRHTSSTVRC